MPTLKAEPGSYILIGQKATLRVSDRFKPATDLGKRTQFFYHLGYAINKWASIDRHLFDLFKFSLATNSEAKASYLFYKATTISEHFMMTDILVRESISNSDLEKWDAITSNFRVLTDFRNRLAHDPATQIVSAVGNTSKTKTDPVPVPEPTWQLYIEQAKMLKPKKPGQTKTAPVTVEQILDHIHHVEILDAAISIFRDKLPKRPRKHPSKSRGQAALPKSGSAKKTYRSRERHKHQPSPSQA